MWQLRGTSCATCVVFTLINDGVLESTSVRCFIRQLKMRGYSLWSFVQQRAHHAFSNGLAQIGLQ